MSAQIESANLNCPYCGEKLEILVDCSAGNQRYIEDCQVCCAPIEIEVEIDFSGQLLSLHSYRDSD